MIDPWHFKTLSDAEYLGWARRKTAELAALDRAIAEKEAAERGPSFREIVAAEAVDALAALGVERPAETWFFAVVATRVWLLELASPAEPQVDQEHFYASPTSPITRRGLMEEWRGPALTSPTDPFGEWQLWRYVTMLAEGVRDERRKRKFGLQAVMPADLAEARLRCEIGNEQWERIRKTARWVLAR